MVRTFRNAVLFPLALTVFTTELSAGDLATPSEAVAIMLDIATGFPAGMDGLVDTLLQRSNTVYPEAQRIADQAMYRDAQQAIADGAPGLVLAEDPWMGMWAFGYGLGDEERGIACSRAGKATLDYIRADQRTMPNPLSALFNRNVIKRPVPLDAAVSMACTISIHLPPSDAATLQKALTDALSPQFGTVTARIGGVQGVSVSFRASDWRGDPAQSAVEMFGG